MNGDVFVAKGYEHIWASSGHCLKWAFCGCVIDVESRAYGRTASYAPGCMDQYGPVHGVGELARFTHFNTTF